MLGANTYPDAFRSSEHVSVECLIDLAFDLLNWGGGVEGAQVASLLVVFKDGAGALVVRGHALNESLAGVVLSVHEWLPSHVVLALDLGWVEGQVVRAATGLMDATTLDSISEHVLVNSKLENTVDVHLLAGEHLVEFLSLCHSPGEAIKKDASLAFGIAEVVLNETDDEVVGDEVTTLHDSVGFLAELGASSNSITEHVTSSQMADTKIILDLGSLGALA